LSFAKKSKNLPAQRQIDSLIHLYQTATHDTTKVSALLFWGEGIYLSYADSALMLWKKAAQLAEKNIADRLDGSSDSTSKAVFQKGLAIAYTNIGYIYKNQGKIDKVLEYLFLGLKIDEELRDKKGMAYSYNNIGVIYDDQGDVEKALEYYFLSLKIREEIKDKKGMAYSYNNIGYIYYTQGVFEKALEYYFLSLKIKEDLNYKKGMDVAYHNIGNTLCKLDSLEEGLRYLKLGLKLRKELRFKGGVSVTLSSIGGWQFKLRQVEAALGSGLEALTVAKEIGHVDYIGRAAKLLSRIYKKQGKFDDALTMYELEIQMRDSVVNEENQKATIRHQMKYEYEKAELIKEQEEKERSRLVLLAETRRNNLHYTGIFIGMLLAVGLVLMLGAVKVSSKSAEAIIFIFFLIVFEFLLILADPYIENWSGGAPGWKLLFNAVLAGLIFPLHQFFEWKLKKRLIKAERGRMSGGHSSQHKRRRGKGGMLMIGLLIFLHSLGFTKSDTLNNAVTLNDSEESPANTKQASIIDSLSTAYQTAISDTDKINSLFDWAGVIYLTNPDSALILTLLNEKLIRKAIENDQEYNEEQIAVLNMDLAEVLGNIAYFYYLKGDVPKTLEFNFKGVELFKKILDENMKDKSLLSFREKLQEGLSSIYNNVGAIYWNKGEIEKALEYYFLSLRLREDINDKNGIATSYNNIGSLYKDQGEIEKALEYYFLCLKIKEKNGMAISYNNIGVVYFMQGETKKALKYHYLSFKMKEEIQDKGGMANSAHNIGTTLFKLDSLNEGMKYLQLALELNKELGYKRVVSANYSAIGGGQLKLGKIDEALKSGLQALVVAKKVGHVDYLKRAAELLTKVYRKQGKFEDALVMYELEVQMRDSIVNEENQKVTIRQQMKYEYEKEQIRKEHEAKDKARIEAAVIARRDNLHYSAIIMGIIALSLLIGVLGFIRVKPKVAEGIIFIAFLILFEFLIVLIDPYVEQWTGGAPGYILIINSGLAGLIFPLHQFFESRLRKRLIKTERKKFREKLNIDIS